MAVHPHQPFERDDGEHGEEASATLATSPEELVHFLEEADRLSDVTTRPFPLTPSELSVATCSGPTVGA